MNDYYTMDENGVARHDTSGFYAKVVLDSVAPCGRRLCSVEAKYWRAIHSEIMTHRDRARNAASSRAIPFIRRDGSGALVKNCTYSMIIDQGFTPMFIGAEQKGMQSGGELEGTARSEAEHRIQLMKDFCLDQCQQLFELGVHKSIINRYLEPWSYITILMTASRWKNFFRLRVHPKAEKHFCLIATMIKAVIDHSKPRVLREGEWHLPYIRVEDPVEAAYCPIPEGLEAQCCNDHGSNDVEEVLKRVSAGRCARLSYLNHNGHRALKDDLTVFKKLIVPDVVEDRDDDVIHACYDSETEVLTSGGWKKWPLVTGQEEFFTLNLNSMETEYQTATETCLNSPYSGEMYKMRGEEVDLLVTPEHNVIARLGEGCDFRLWRISELCDRSIYCLNDYINPKENSCKTKVERVENWSGKVYCVTVPNGTLYVRRNGIRIWSGNSPLEHVAQARNDPNYRSGPYQGWHQFRKDFTKEDAPE